MSRRQFGPYARPIYDTTPLEHRRRMTVDVGWHPDIHRWVWTHARYPAAPVPAVQLREEPREYALRGRGRSVRERGTEPMLERLGNLVMLPEFDGLQVGSRTWCDIAERILAEEGR